LIVDDFFRNLNSEDVDNQETTNVRKETAQFQQQSGRHIPKSKLLPASSDNHWIFGSVLWSWDSRSYEDFMPPAIPCITHSILGCGVSYTTSSPENI
jgi:hypothetical protein